MSRAASGQWVPGIETVASFRVLELPGCAGHGRHSALSLPHCEPRDQREAQYHRRRSYCSAVATDPSRGRCRLAPPATRLLSSVLLAPTQRPTFRPTHSPTHSPTSGGQRSNLFAKIILQWRRFLSPLALAVETADETEPGPTAPRTTHHRSNQPTANGSQQMTQKQRNCPNDTARRII